ncbi:hypothetical protein FNV43_RR04719 [Rhamnella rubrinervis]|uniref:DUF7806 domain-containing protein n=1 Tax=Rhamnella rubrinervis TaxID=2594499 RepID=A0A8K0HKA7_9ROSA|nr:hypothetical protein FNV43_RR04719 [Rhamnella rubrinervis]
MRIQLGSLSSQTGLSQMEMEALYKKLYDKYTKLKTKNFSELDKINKEQEVKFANCVSAAEELIQHLQNKNEKLHYQVNDLRSELASIRSSMDKQCAEYEKILMEENQKNKVLSEEVERLQKLQEGNLSSSKHRRIDNVELSAPGDAQIESRELSDSSTRSKTQKRMRYSGSGTDVIMPSGGGYDADMQRESAKDLHKEALSSMAFVNNQQPECCRRTIDRSGGAVNGSIPANCTFRALVEYLVGMKFSTVTQSERICISAVHQSSGYSFSLTWLDNTGSEEVQLEYRVSSLGTFERVAPEWMKEVIMFSTTMCPIFFERVSRVVKLHS